MFPSLDEFLTTKGRWPRNSFVKEKGFKSLYVRYTRRYIKGRIYEPVLDIADIQALRPGKGAFTHLIERLRKEYPHLGLYVESVLNIRLRGKLLSMGFEYVGPCEESPCYFLDPRGGIHAGEEAPSKEPEEAQN